MLTRRQLSEVAENRGGGTSATVSARMAQQGAAMGESVVFVDGRGVGLQLPRVLFKNELKRWRLKS